MDFLKNKKRFSFKLDEKDAWELPFKCNEICDGDSVTTVFEFEGGLKITNAAKKYGKYGAYE